MSTEKFEYGEFVYHLKVKQCEEHLDPCDKCVFHRSGELCSVSPDCGITGYFKIKRISTK